MIKWQKKTKPLITKLIKRPQLEMTRKIQVRAAAFNMDNAFWVVAKAHSTQSNSLAWLAAIA